MAAYIIADVKVSDHEKYKGYTALTPAAIAAAGGRFIVRGGQHEVLEGRWKPNRVVLLEFPNFSQARAFYDSALYVEARNKRAGATEYFNMIIVEGVGAPTPEVIPRNEGAAFALSCSRNHD
jgi:uncharacterized protein (DUF1330 family)